MRLPPIGAVLCWNERRGTNDGVGDESGNMSLYPWSVFLDSACLTYLTPSRFLPDLWFGTGMGCFATQQRHEDCGVLFPPLVAPQTRYVHAPISSQPGSMHGVLDLAIWTLALKIDKYAVFWAPSR